MKVILAKNAGFCNGVKSAVNQAVSLAEKYGKIYTLGELVHNENVTDFLNRKGAICIKIEDACNLKKGDVALIRAHGITKQLEEELRDRGVVLFDATCPVVKRNQKIAEDRAKTGGRRHYRRRQKSRRGDRSCVVCRQKLQNGFGYRRAAHRRKKHLNSFSNHYFARKI